MYRLRFVYICDHCGKVVLPAVYYCGIDAVKTMPHGWGQLGKAHLCNKCYGAYQVLVNEQEKPKCKEDNARKGDWTSGGSSGFVDQYARYKDAIRQMKEELERIRRI